MRTLIRMLSPFWVIVFVFFGFAAVQQYKFQTSVERGARKAMTTYYIGRFSIEIPSLMEQKLRSSALRHVAIKETVWPKNLPQEQARQAEWEVFLANTRKIPVPDGASTVILQRDDFPRVGRWTRGTFYYDGNYSSRIGIWTLLTDAGPVGVWLTGEPSVVERELVSHKMARNLENIARAYRTLDPNTIQSRQHERFYLQHGAIDLPYAEKEESITRFEGHPLNLTLLIEMYMDFKKEIETVSLFDGTRAMLAAALVTPGGSMSKIRLRKREVAGMPGEEAVLRVREGDSKDLVFTWQFNGKDDSGEYPTTRIEMESPDGNLTEKLEIWDAILDSMQPMFERKR